MVVISFYRNISFGHHVTLDICTKLDITTVVSMTKTMYWNMDESLAKFLSNRNSMEQSLAKWIPALWQNSIVKRLELITHYDVIKWKHFPCYWPFVMGIHRSPVISPHKGQLGGALMCAWINGWAINRDAGDLRRHGAHCDVTVMCFIEHLIYLQT